MSRMPSDRNLRPLLVKGGDGSLVPVVSLPAARKAGLDGVEKGRRLAVCASIGAYGADVDPGGTAAVCHMRQAACEGRPVARPHLKHPAVVGVVRFQQNPTGAVPALSCATVDPMVMPVAVAIRT